MPAPALIDPETLAASLKRNVSLPVPPLRSATPEKDRAVLRVPAFAPVSDQVLARLGPWRALLPVPPNTWADETAGMAVRRTVSLPLPAVSRIVSQPR